MNSSKIKELIDSRINQAQESLQESSILLREGLFRGSVNRACYAMFYSVLALAALRQVATSKHSGVISFFDREFVKPGFLPRDLSKSFHLAFQKRQENDYGEIFAVTEEEAQQINSETKNFVKSIETYLRSNSSV